MGIITQKATSSSPYHMFSNAHTLNGGGGGGGGVSAIGDTSGVSVQTTSGSVLLMMLGVGFSIVTDSQTETGWVDVAMAEQEDESKDWLGEEVQNSIEVGLAIRADNVASLSKTPCNRVQSP